MNMLKSRINEVLNERGLKQVWVAKQMGINQTVLSRWANNRGKPSVDRLFKLAKVIGCKVDDLYEWIEEK